jgi:hypothetical protein
VEVVYVMVAVPGAMAVIIPPPSTVTTLLLEEVQGVGDGASELDNRDVAPTHREVFPEIAEIGFTVIDPVAFTGLQPERV